MSMDDKVRGVIKAHISSKGLDPMSDPNSDLYRQLYGSIAEAETGSFENPWIRTSSAPPEGSSAFGPVQMTKTKIEDYIEHKKVSKESAKFYKDHMQGMLDNFLYYGKETDRPGYSVEYDYSDRSNPKAGTGNFDTKYAPQYSLLAREMLMADYKKNKGDLQKTIRDWRGVDRAADKKYYKKVTEGFNQVPLGNLLRR
jgi:hypothetical protein